MSALTIGVGQCPVWWGEPWKSLFLMVSGEPSARAPEGSYLSGSGAIPDGGLVVR